MRIGRARRALSSDWFFSAYRYSLSLSPSYVSSMVTVEAMGAKKGESLAALAPERQTGDNLTIDDQRADADGQEEERTSGKRQ